MVPSSASNAGFPTESRLAAERARKAWRAWRETPLRRRLRVVRALRYAIADHGDLLADSVDLIQRTERWQTYTAELIPLADACRFLETNARRILRTRRPGARDRPLWLGGTRAEVRREPFGLILVIGPSNYPLLLPGVQTIQALAAGNAVLWKPGRGGTAAARALAGMLAEAGLPPGLLTVLDESADAAKEAIRCGVDKVVLTGSRETGLDVAHRLARTVTPSVMELSGCDAVFVLRGADLDLVTRAVMFGLTFNGGFTCMSPRRLFVDERLRAELESRLTEALRSAPDVPLDPAILPRLTRAIETAVGRGARRLDGGTVVESPTRPLILTDVSPRSPLMTEDIGAPVMAIAGFADATEARESYDACGFGLGVSVFGATDEASRFADALRCGVVVINDLIAPTADPRLPFGGTGLSGHGVTRGEEGLLELTRPWVRIVRSGRRYRHLEPVGPRESHAIEALLRLTHGRSLRVRGRALIDLVRGSGAKSKTAQEKE